MKRRKYLSLLIAGALSLALAGTALAFAMGNIDGVWEYVEDNTDPNSNAFCVTYGTGQGTSETARSRNDPAIQGTGGTDENQVHYGKGSSVYGDCPTTSAGVTSSWFDAQSGLGFDGNNSVGSSLLEGTPFWLGRLTHYNRPIYLSNDGSTPSDWAFMRWVDVDVVVSGITCSNGQPPNEGGSLTFTYRVNFDETPNGCSSYNPCQYTNYGTCPSEGCPDRVQVASAPPAASFTCDDADEPVQGVYTITLLGFQPHTSSDCSTQTYNPANLSNNYVTRESTTNNACLWAQISDFEPTAVELKSFTAEAGKKEIVLRWETTSETDNLGFNLYRATGAADAERVQLNADLIPADPGSTTGAQYQFVDSNVSRNTLYYYWLEDVDIYGKAGLHGAVTAVIGKVPGAPQGKPDTASQGKNNTVPDDGSW